MTKGRAYNPSQVIFAATSECNLNCRHCFIKQTDKKLSIDDAKKFLNANKEHLEKIGFSGGEPFLYPEFLYEISKETVRLDLLFDQINTNGDWWKTEGDLRTTLLKLYNSGYDGKISLSCDSFHSQHMNRIIIFIQSVQSIFGKGSLNIQCVLKENEEEKTPIKLFTIEENFPEIKIHLLHQSFSSDNKDAWKSAKWFKDDFCEGPGHIFYVHPDGKIAPCCGFANENDALIIGTINDDYDTLMENARQNKIIKMCYEKGLKKSLPEIKQAIKKAGQKLPGRTKDICTFCDYICKNYIP